MNITKLHKDITKQKEQLKALEGFITENETFLISLEKANMTATILDTIDLDNASRQDVLTIIKHFGGKWNKEKNGARINYIRETTDNKPPIRLWSAEIPPCCNIVKKTRIVPATPEHVEEYEELSCPVKLEDV